MSIINNLIQHKQTGVRHPVSPVFTTEVIVDEVGEYPCGFSYATEYHMILQLKTTYVCNDAQKRDAQDMALKTLKHKLYSDIKEQLMEASLICTQEDVRERINVCLREME